MNRFAIAFLAAAVATPLVAQQQAGSPVVDMMVRGRNALNDLKYAEADSIARRVLALGTLLTKQQTVDALQLRAAAAYPDEQVGQNSDTAIAMIRQLIEMGASQGIPREMTWPGLDSLFVFVARASQPAKVLLGSRIAGSVLYVNGEPQGVIQGLRVVLVSPGKPVNLSIRAEGCASWDSTLTAQASDSLRIGFRNPRCKS